MEKWFVMAKKADFEKWASKYQISPMLARIIRNRDVTEEEEVGKFLYGELKDCYSPWLLYGMEQAVEEIIKALEENKKIRIIGDYDVDGICSSYILTKGLKVMGANVDTAIPHRIHDGYGLNEGLIREAYNDGVQMIITCDNGISAASQVELANSLGIGVVVTDHHEVPFVMENEKKKEILPPALAVVDPKQEQDSYPFPGICGGVVAYKVMCALQEKTKHPELKECLEELLEFAAFSTVCDVMELKDENRIIVKEGLKRLKNTNNPGLAALMDVNGLEREHIAAYHLGFVLGPCLNATGRLDTAKRALELLQCTEKAQAMTVASELKALNDSRKNLTLQGVEMALAYVESHHMEEEPVMVIYLPEVHESLAGIIAGRVREKYNKPTFILTKGEEGVKGSGRSIESYNMFEKMTEVKEFFTKYGGHKLAAGLSMEEENIPALQKALSEKCGLTEEDFVPQVHIDIALPFSYATMELAEELSVLEPFGVGNAKPLFAQKDVVIKSVQIFGKNRNVMKLQALSSEGKRIVLMHFGDICAFEEFMTHKYGSQSMKALYDGRGEYKIAVVYQLGLNSFRGVNEVQYVMTNYS